MVPPAADGRPCRESLRHTPMMNGHGKSDSSVVPQKSPNKAGLMAAAEEAEGRGLAKGNSHSKTRSGRRAGAARTVRWSGYVRWKGMCRLGVIT
jgi:hypothetical protein